MLAKASQFGITDACCGACYRTRRSAVDTQVWASRAGSQDRVWFKGSVKQALLTEHCRARLRMMPLMQAKAAVMITQKKRWWQSGWGPAKWVERGLQQRRG